MSDYTIELVSKQGGQWAILRWDVAEGQWDQVGPYYDTEAEANQALQALKAEVQS